MKQEKNSADSTSGSCDWPSPRSVEPTRPRGYTWLRRRGDMRAEPRGALVGDGRAEEQIRRRIVIRSRTIRTRRVGRSAAFHELTRSRSVGHERRAGWNEKARCAQVVSEKIPEQAGSEAREVDETVVTRAIPFGRSVRNQVTTRACGLATDPVAHDVPRALAVSMAGGSRNGTHKTTLAQGLRPRTAQYTRVPKARQHPFVILGVQRPGSQIRENKERSGLGNRWGRSGGGTREWRYTNAPPQVIKVLINEEGLCRESDKRGQQRMSTAPAGRTSGARGTRPRALGVAGGGSRGQSGWRRRRGTKGPGAGEVVKRVAAGALDAVLGLRACGGLGDERWRAERQADGISRRLAIRSALIPLRAYPMLISDSFCLFFRTRPPNFATHFNLDSRVPANLQLIPIRTWRIRRSTP
ncbi:hypothetical protein B0H17DRAFT_1151572 [Mycena rosella]|uniref:Uncharacterized protein n=1 Tax=Mycena rosella TaxID=1033263 RepID=A0AAD7BJJ2_MYCRO|nr:hypothetical protein B0H17DRAFT_1151572 [Mycena rosella]